MAKGILSTFWRIPKNKIVEAKVVNLNSFIKGVSSIFFLRNSDFNKKDSKGLDSKGAKLMIFSHKRQALIYITLHFLASPQCGNGLVFYYTSLHSWTRTTCISSEILSLFKRDLPNLLLCQYKQNQQPPWTALWRRLSNLLFVFSSFFTRESVLSLAPWRAKMAMDFFPFISRTKEEDRLVRERAPLVN